MIYRVFITFILFIFFIKIAQSSQLLPDIYLFLGGNKACDYSFLLNDPNIKGAQVIYSWKILEPKKGEYNFDLIQDDLACLQRKNKNLFIQIQDRSFTPNNIPVPDYLLSDYAKYKGGVVQQVDNPGEGKEKAIGWVAKQWEPAVRKRFQKLLIQLGKKFDGKISGINLPETSIDILANEEPHDFCERYFQSVLENITVLRTSFNKSHVIQYVNFIPCEWNNNKGYMEKLFNMAAKKSFGIGNPDTVPYKSSQMENSYPFLHTRHSELPIVTIAVQEPDYTYTNPQTGKNFTIPELYYFNKDYLGAKIIFWNIQEPEFSQRLLPFIYDIYSTPKFYTNMDDNPKYF